MLYGNKNDKAVKEQYSEQMKEKIQKFREQFDCMFFCGSARDKNDKTIDQMMTKIVYILYNNLKREKMLQKHKLNKLYSEHHEENVSKKEKLGGMIKTVL